MPARTQLSRRCTCPRFAEICPVNLFSRVMGKERGLSSSTRRRGRIFAFSYDYFLRRVRECLRELGIEDAQSYSTKAFRRGTAQQMLESGSSLAEVMKAAQWRGPAYRLYLEQNALDELALFQALEGLSDDEGDDLTTAPANGKRSGPSSARDSAEAKQARFMESYFGR